MDFAQLSRTSECRRLQNSRITAMVSFTDYSVCCDRVVENDFV